MNLQKRLALGVILIVFLFSVLAVVSAEALFFNTQGVLDDFLIDGSSCGDCCNNCQLIIDNPLESHWYDPINIEWHYEGNCSIVDQNIYYYIGDCDADSNPIVTHLGSGAREYDWNVYGLDDGNYCVSVFAESHPKGCLYDEVEGFSGVFHLDQTPPKVKRAYVSSGPYVKCDSENPIDCDYYITQNSKVSFACTDTGSGKNKSYYRYKVDDGAWTDWIEYPEGGIQFGEDTKHEMEYYCTDNVGKESSHKFSIFVVDTQEPEIEKTISGIYYGDCPPESENDEDDEDNGNGIEDENEDNYEENCYIKTSTEIHVDATDPEPHPVNEVVCEYSVEVKESCEPCLEGELCECVGGGYIQGNLTPPFDIQFSEESEHTLKIICWDALGNEVVDVEKFYVDKTPPVTEKFYEGPFFENDNGEWIDTATWVFLRAYDPQPHPVGVKDTLYRVTLVDNRYCETEYSGCQNANGTGNFVEYTEPFTIDEKSCHLIEYKSIDRLNNFEEPKRQCVYVDKTAPETVKEVGTPSHECTYRDKLCEPDWDWKVTMDTEITLDCEEQGEHPSGVAGLWYRILLDGELYTDWTFVSSEFLPYSIKFPEESEHLLEFYCVDNVNKKSEVDSELFKVEGTVFRIPLYKKWNLISVPFVLVSDNIEEVFEDIKEDIESVWMYDGTEWHVYTPDAPSDLTEMQPGWGYWVLAKEDTELIVGGSLLSPAPGVPPSRDLQEGWNLIGHYGLVEKPVYCSLYSLIDTTVGYPRWSALFGYDAVTDEFIGLDFSDETNPGEGYWIEMDIADLYSPATTCWGLI